MGEIIITITKDEIISDLTSKASNISTEFSRIVDDIKEIFGVNLTIETPVGCTGDLVSGNMTIDSGEYSFYTDNRMPYYPFIVLGTSDHPINSPVFICSIGEWRYIAHHPGTAPNDYPLNALEDSEGEVESKCQEFLNWIVD